MSDGHPEPLRRRLATRDGLDVEEVAVVDVVGRVRAAPGAAAERERRRHRVVDAAQRADRGGRVDEDPAGADREREAVDHGLVGRVDGRGVAEATVLGHQLAGGDRVLDRRRAHHAEHRHQLLLEERMGGERVEVGRQRREQDLVRVGRLEPGEGAEVDARLTEHLHLDAPSSANDFERQRSASSSFSSRAPMRSNSATIAS